MNNISVKTIFRVAACANTAFWAITAAMITLLIVQVTGGGDAPDEAVMPSIPMGGIFQAAYYLSALFTAIAMAVAIGRCGVGALLLACSAMVQIVLGLITTGESLLGDYLQVLEGNVFITPFIMMLAALVLNILGTGMIAAKVRGMKLACGGYAVTTVSFAAVLALFFALISRLTEALDDESDADLMSQDAFSIIMITLVALMVIGIIMQLIGWWRAKAKYDNN